MKTIRLIVISAILAIALVCLGWYFITSFNSIRVYRIRLDGENFWMNDGFFMKSNMKNVFQLTDLKYIGEEKLENNEFRTKIYVKDEENNDELIIYDGIYVSPVYIYEIDGYDEYFTDRYAGLLKDNLYIDIRYINEDGKIVKETHKLETTLEFANNKILELKESSKDNLNVSDSVNDFRKRNDVHEKLLNNGFELCTEDDNLAEDCFVKNADDVEIMVHVSDTIFVNVICDELKIYFNSLDNTFRFMDAKEVLYNIDYNKLDNLKVENVIDDTQLKMVDNLTRTLDLLNI